MPLKHTSFLILAGSLALTACAQNSRERTKVEPVATTKTAVQAEAETADSTMLQIGEESFEVTRRTIDGVLPGSEQDQWMVKVNGWNYACEAADPQGCMMTVSDARLGDLTPILPDAE